jgi:hypothetical protein
LSTGHNMKVYNKKCGNAREYLKVREGSGT